MRKSIAWPAEAGTDVFRRSLSTEPKQDKRTGATYVTLARKVADRLRLDLSASPKHELQTANGKGEALFVIIPSASVEGLSTERIPAVVIDDLGPGVDGLLGQSFLSRFEMKQSRGVLEFAARSPTPSALGD